jgi:predicted small secreted protein
MKRTLAPFLFALFAVTTAGASHAVGVGYSIRSDGDQKLYRIDLKTGVTTPVGTAKSSGFEGIEGLAFAPGCQTLYGVDDVKDRLVTCNRTTGACETVGSLGFDITDTGLTFANDGNLYLSTDAPKDPIRFFRVDPGTGVATWIGNPGIEVTGLAANPLAIYGLGGDGKDVLVQIDPATGAATTIGPLGTVTLQDGGLDFDHDGTLYGLNDLGPGSGKASQIFKIDLGTGRATVVAVTKDPSGKALNGFEGFAIDQGMCSVHGFGSAAAVDAPALNGWGVAVLALGLVAAALFVLRR